MGKTVEISDLNNIYWCIESFNSFNQMFKDKYCKDSYDWSRHNENLRLVKNARKSYENIKKP